MTTLLERSSASTPETVDRLLVTVRDPATRHYQSVGFLRRLDHGYQFAYLVSALKRADFRPLPGLSRAVDAPVYADLLFPVFAERVMSARRSDRSVSMEALGLPMSAAPFEVLTRSHGQRVGDTIELLPAPMAAPGAPVSFPFLTHGVRHLTEQEQGHIASLKSGQNVGLVPDRANPVNPHALVVTDGSSVHLGWVPEPLIAVVESLSDRRLSVERANGPEVGFHFRLLVRLAGRTPSDRGLFEGPEWATLPE